MSDLINGRTPEQIKRILQWFNFDCSDYECDRCLNEDICNLQNCNESVMARDALAYIERLESAQPKWISVEEQPNPSKDGVYLCHGYWIRSGRKQTETAEYLGEWKIANNFILTHWMPIPEPPEVSE